MEYLIICRICNQSININLMDIHNQTCRHNAEQRKKLVQLNLQVARLCEKAYMKKHRNSFETRIKIVIVKIQ
ncbi:unnamed protein product (macronuclear) [Paramecium tetraurelia]|uniref:C2H2-type domain-containing protein n=1 Tax=Paramecium tetraurelia TaxID=5888 RepID=A0EHK5_PARTE|nr:uncharacterized protein GSPATT00027120001 [Paramecium tetraurelia]CAK94796.1 unnamed protein product [Paramecium tetraurelia]|eukprot:XP_001462169.1 hypothetical protein (macronuclear) [Paramecium tetraurelia strain d4-2]